MLLSNLDWESLSSLRDTVDPADLVFSVPRLAREESYAKSNIDAWKSDYEDRSGVSGREKIETFGAQFIYKRPSDDVELCGYFVIPSSVRDRCGENDMLDHRLPVVILFHTGAGPQDVFIRYQADKLCREKIWGDNGCIIFIADLISDHVGWAWSDRGMYWKKRKDLLEITERDGQKKRWLLSETVKAAVDSVKTVDMLDCERIAAFGYCLGGQPILELGMSDVLGVRVLASFHGLFDKTDEIECIFSNDIPGRRCMIFTGAADPFVSISDVNRAADILKKYGWMVEVVTFEGVFHNFSNPRIHYEDAGMGYDEDAANHSWSAAVALLKNAFAL